MQPKVYGFLDNLIWIGKGKFSITTRILVVGSQRVKNYEDMKKEDLIISVLKSKESIARLFNDDDDHNNNNNSNSNLYNNEINDIRRILNRLRDTLTKKDRKEINDKLYKIEHQRNISEA